MRAKMGDELTVKGRYEEPMPVSPTTVVSGPASSASRPLSPMTS